MGHDDDGPPRPCQVAQRLHERFLVARVEAGCRLVEEEERRLGQELAADAHPLALPAGQAIQAEVRALLEVQLRHHLVDARRSRRRGNVAREPQLRRVRQGLPYRQLRMEDVGLGDEAHPRPDVLVRRVDVAAVEDDVAALGRTETGQRVQQGRLPGARRTDDGEHARRLEREPNLVEDPTPAGVDHEVHGAEPRRPASCDDPQPPGMELERLPADADEVAVLDPLRATDAPSVEDTCRWRWRGPGPRRRRRTRPRSPRGCARPARRRGSGHCRRRARSGPTSDRAGRCPRPPRTASLPATFRRLPAGRGEWYAPSPARTVARAMLARDDEPAANRRFDGRARTRALALPARPVGAILLVGGADFADCTADVLEAVRRFLEALARVCDARRRRGRRRGHRSGRHALVRGGPSRRSAGRSRWSGSRRRAPSRARHGPAARSRPARITR